MSQTRIRLADYVARFVRDQGVDCVFLVPGGGAMFLSDTLCHQTGIAPVFFHHEQAAAMAAEAYARIADVPPVRNVTTSPGSINAFNGAFGAWTDSMPMTEISGQVRRATSLATKPVPGLREQGDQEDEPVRMARTISAHIARLHAGLSPHRGAQRSQPRWRRMAHRPTSTPCWISVVVTAL